MSGMRKYTYAACMVECKIENIAKLCNCIPFYYPAFGMNLMLAINR